MQNNDTSLVPPRVVQMQLDLNIAGINPFKPHLTKLHGCFHTAFDEWRLFMERMSHVSPDISDRTRASFVYDIACCQAERLFAGEEDVYLTRKLGFLIIIVKNRYVLRLRKLDGKNLAYQNATKQTREYFGGRIQTVLPGIAPELIPMICGYGLDSTNNGLGTVSLSLQYKRKRLWFEDIPGVAIDVEDAPEAAKAAFDEAQAEPRKKGRVRITANRNALGVDAPETNQK